MYHGSNAFNAQILTENLDLANQNYNSKQLNSIIYKLEHDLMCNTFMNRFKWSFGDLKINDRFYIERVILFKGGIAIFKDRTLGALALPFQELAWNIYSYPTRIRVFSDSTGYFYNKEIEVDNNVFLLWDNPLHFTPIRIIRRYAREVADVSRSVEVYAKAMKKPYIVYSDFDKKKSVERALAKQYDNDFFITLDSDIKKDFENSVLDITQNNSHNAEDLRGLYMHKKSIYDEMLSKIGIETSNLYKGAQMNRDEVNKNDAHVLLTLEQSYECRVGAAKKLSEIAQTNVTCENLVDISDGTETEQETGD